MGGPQNAAVVLFCAEDDDLELVEVVHLGRERGIPFEVIPGVEHDDHPLVSAIERDSEGLFVLMTSENLPATRVKALRSLFQGLRYDGQAMLVTELVEGRADEVVRQIGDRLIQLGYDDSIHTSVNIRIPVRHLTAVPPLTPAPAPVAPEDPPPSTTPAPASLAAKGPFDEVRDTDRNEVYESPPDARPPSAGSIARRRRPIFIGAMVGAVALVALVAWKLSGQNTPDAPSRSEQVLGPMHQPGATPADDQATERELGFEDEAILVVVPTDGKNEKKGRRKRKR